MTGSAGVHSESFDQLPPLRQLPREGHTYDQNTITGGTAHFGDTYNVTINQGRATLESPLTPQSKYRKYVFTLPSLNEDKPQYRVTRALEIHFTGRQTQLNQIKQCFSAHRPSTSPPRQKIVVLEGLGGSGKTQVALKYADRNKLDYWGVFWIDASSKTSIESRYTEFASLANAGQTWIAGRDWLSECSRPWLLILDNMDNVRMKQEIFDFIPFGDRGHVLITTRLHEVAIHATVGRIEFRQMDPDEATELLLTCAYPEADTHGKREPSDREAARGIAAELGYLAIALTLAGETIRQGIYSIHDYLHQYLRDRNRLLNSKIPTDELDIIATFEIPFKRIEQKQIEEFQDATVLAYMFAFLHFDSISEALLENAWSRKSKMFPLHSELPDLFRSGSRPRLRRALRVLSDRSLIQRHLETNTYSIHPIVHSWLKSRIDNDDKLIFWLNQTMCLLSCGGANILSIARGTPILPHVEYCLSVAAEKAPEILETREGMCEAEIFASIYAANRSWKRSVEILQQVLECRKQKQGRYHEETLQTKRNLSGSYYGDFNIKAALEIQKEILWALWLFRSSILDYIFTPLSPTHLPFLIAWTDMAWFLLFLGSNYWARWATELATRGLRLRLGKDNPKTWSAEFNLGRVYLGTGKFDEGHALIASVASKMKQAEYKKDRQGFAEFGVTSEDNIVGKEADFELLDVFMARTGVGMSLLRQNKNLHIAQRIVANVLEDRSMVLGKDHPYTLWSINDLARIYCAQERYSEAIEMLEPIVPIISLRLGTDHFGTRMTKANLTRTYGFAHKWEKADALFSEIYPHIKRDDPVWFKYTWSRARIKSEIDPAAAEKDCKTLIQIAKRKWNLPDNFRMTVELLGYVYLKGSRADELTSLLKQYSWLDMECVKNPSSSLNLGIGTV